MRPPPARELGMIFGNKRTLRSEIIDSTDQKGEGVIFAEAAFCQFSFSFVTPSVRQVFMFVVVLIIFFSHCDLRAETYGRDNAWSVRLGELNYLIMKTSAVNIVYGLNLSREQAVRLRDLARRIDDVALSAPEMKGVEYPETAAVRDAFANLFEQILSGRQISDVMKKNLNGLRLREVEIIKKSLIGAQGFMYSGEGCLACHAPPNKFPDNDVSGHYLSLATVKEQDRIDRAHLKGMFGNHGMLELWEMKSEVDQVLTGVQRYMMRSIQCSLLPPDYLAHPTRVGQAILTGNWYAYFKEVRAVPERQWQTYRRLYVRYPFRDMLLALSPGIATEHRNEIVTRMGKIVGQARRLDAIDYALKKKELVAAMNQEFESVTGRHLETNQQREARQFRTAMFLLFPENRRIYDEYIRRMDAN